MIPIVEEILDMAGMMVKILATGSLSVNQRGRVLGPANTQTDPTPGERVFFIHPLRAYYMILFAWLHSVCFYPADPAGLYSLWTFGSKLWYACI